MEDRLDAGVWLEMTDLSADVYSAKRVPEVLALPGVERGGCWENANPNRTDLPRKVPEFGLLGLYEVDDSFAAPDGVVGHHFRRHARPPQGTLSPNPTLGLLVVFISPRQADQAQIVRDWADFTHIREIAATANPGSSMISVYENTTGGDPRFLHLYEMDTADPEACFFAVPDLVAERLGGGMGTPAFDAWAYHPAVRILYVNTFRRVGA
jgi:hypothetical protein